MLRMVSSVLQHYLNFVNSVLSPTLKSLITGRLVFVKDDHSRGFSIATGKRGEVTIEVMRVGNRVYIPISSVKGVLRRFGEVVAKSMVSMNMDSIEASITLAHCELEGEGLRHVCYNVTKVVSDLQSLSTRDLEVLALKGFIPRDKVVEVSELLKGDVVVGLRHLESFISQFCIICRLFGGPGIAGKLRIVNITLDNAKVGGLTHIAIDRDRRVVSEGALYMEEFVEPGKIAVEFIARNVELNMPEYTLLLKTVGLLKEVGIAIGHSKSRGLGWLNLDERETKLIYIDFNQATTPKQLIEILTKPELYGKEIII